MITEIIRDLKNLESQAAKASRLEAELWALTEKYDRLLDSSLKMLVLTDKYKWIAINLGYKGEKDEIC